MPAMPSFESSMPLQTLSLGDQLDSALPLVEAAMSALSSLTKNNITEMRSYKKPPPLVELVMEAVLLLLGQKKTDWVMAQTILNDKDFLKKLLAYDKDNVPLNTLQRLQKYIADPNFTPEVVGTVCQAARCLCMWVHAIDAYAKVAMKQQFKPQVPEAKAIPGPSSTQRGLASPKQRVMSPKQRTMSMSRSQSLPRTGTMGAASSAAAQSISPEASPAAPVQNLNAMLFNKQGSSGSPSKRGPPSPGKQPAPGAVLKVQGGGTSRGTANNLSMYDSFVDPSLCYAFGYGLGEVFVGEIATFTIQAVDKDGNKKQAGGDKFRMQIRGPSSPNFNIIDNYDGTYRVEYCTNISGFYSVTVTHGGAHIQDSPFSVVIKTSLVQAGSCSAFGKGLNLATASEPASFMVQARSVDGYDRNAGGEHFQVILKGDDSEVQGYVTDNDDGTYLVQYTPQQAGIYSVWVMLGGKHISGGPFNLVVVPGECYPPCCTTTGEGTASAIAGAKTYFTVHAHDKEKNHHDKGGCLFNIRIDQVSGTSERPPESRTTDNEDGTYLVQYSCWGTGNYQLSVQHKGIHIHGSPYSINVQSAITDPQQTVLSGEGYQVTTAGQRTTFTVTAIDAHGNKCDNFDDKFVINIIMKGDKSPDSHKAVQPEVKPDMVQSGTYYVTYTVLVAGDYLLSVALQSPTGQLEPIAGSPFKLVCHPAATDPACCTVSGSGINICTAGERTSFFVQALDHYGNAQTSGLDEFHWLGVHTESGHVFSGQVSQQIKGLHTISYVTEKSGFYQLEVSLAVGNELLPIKGSPFELLVNPAPTHAPSCALLGDALRRAVAGVQAEFEIVSKDQYGNVNHFGEDWYDVVLTLMSHVHVTGKVQFQEDHTYLATYTASVAGVYSMSVTLDGAPVKGSPYRVEVVPGETYPPRCHFIALEKLASHACPMSYFMIQACDVCGNNKTTGGDNFEAVVKVGSVTQDATNTDNQDGTYLVSFPATKAGIYSIDVSLNGLKVEGSPLQSHVKPARSWAAKSVAVGHGLTYALMGRAGQFLIQGRDQFGNNCTTGGEVFRASIRGPSTVIAEVRDNNDGTYSVFYIPIQTGKYKIDVRLDREKIPGSPFEATVVAKEN